MNTAKSNKSPLPFQTRALNYRINCKKKTNYKKKKKTNHKKKETNYKKKKSICKKLIYLRNTSGYEWKSKCEMLNTDEDTDQCLSNSCYC